MTCPPGLMSVICPANPSFCGLLGLTIVQFCVRFTPLGFDCPQPKLQGSSGSLRGEQSFVFWDAL
uniref:Uncharacterized protein n=1 Tax=Arion vulgaris TaxID=1028688 RepID=A0A0B7AHC4_9EUPU